MSELTQKRPGGALHGEIGSPENMHLNLKNSNPAEEKEVLEKLKKEIMDNFDAGSLGSLDSDDLDNQIEDAENDLADMPPSTMNSILESS